LTKADISTYLAAMEQELFENLLVVARRFAEGRGIGLSTAAKQLAGDVRFFRRLESDGATFTVRKYDEVLQAASANWPEKAVWPEGIDRPSVEAPEAAQ